MSKYLRKYELLVGNPGQEGVLIEDFHIEFNIEKSAKSTLNKAEFRIFNLSQSTRDKILDLEDTDGVLVFKAGYEGEGNPVTLFSGNIIEVTSPSQGADVVTTIICGDGYVATRESMTNQTFPKKTSLRSVLTGLIRDMGLDQGTVKGDILDNQVYNNGLSLTDSTYQLLDKYTRPFKLHWSIQEGAINILPHLDTTVDSAVLVATNNGLVGDPVATGKEPAARKADKKPKRGVKIQTLLNPALEIDRKVNLQSKHFTGIYVCTKLVHKGSYEGNDWLTEAELKFLPNLTAV